MELAAWFYVGAFTVGAALFYVYTRIGKLIRCAFFTAFTGLAALGLLWMAGGFFALELTVTPLSAVISALLGIPGVIFMLVMNLL